MVQLPPALKEAIIFGELKYPRDTQWVKGLLDANHPEGHTPSLSSLFEDIEQNEESEKSLLNCLSILAILGRNDSIDISKNNIEGMVRPTVEHLSSTYIISLNLSECGLTSENFKIKWLLEHTPNLEVINISKNDLSSTDIFDEMTDGEEDVGRHKVDRRAILINILPLGRLKQLKHLDISKTNIGYLEKKLAALTYHLSQHTNIAHLNISGNGLRQKACAYVIVGFDELSNGPNHLLTIVLGLKKQALKNIQSRLIQWNQMRERENQDQAIARLSLFSKRERQAGIATLRCDDKQEANKPAPDFKYSDAKIQDILNTIKDKVKLFMTPKKHKQKENQRPTGVSSESLNKRRKLNQNNPFNTLSSDSCSVISQFIGDGTCHVRVE